MTQENTLRMKSSEPVPVDLIVQPLPLRFAPGPPRTREEGAFRPERDFNSPVQSPNKKSTLPQQRHLPAPRIPHPEISKETLSGHVVVRLTPDTASVSTRFI